MTYLIDSSVGFKWLVAEHDTDKALKIRDDYRNGMRVLIAPDVFPIEIAHGLSRAERQKRISSSEGATLITDILASLPQLFSSLDLLSRAYEISSVMRVGVYDCLYVALAEREGCELVTADEKLVRNLQPHFPFILALASLP